MAQRQLSIRSDRARDLAERLAAETGFDQRVVVEKALELYAQQIAAQALPVDPHDAEWRRIRAMVQRAADAAPAGLTSDHRRMYDEHGLPR